MLSSFLNYKISSLVFSIRDIIPYSMWWMPSVVHKKIKNKIIEFNDNVGKFWSWFLCIVIFHYSPIKGYTQAWPTNFIMVPQLLVDVGCYKKKLTYETVERIRLLRFFYLLFIFHLCFFEWLIDVILNYILFLEKCLFASLNFR